MSDYDDNYENVFGKTTCERGSWVFCKETQKLVPKEEYYQQQAEAESPTVLKPIEEFRSPVDGSVISDRGQLREHNKRHGVTDMRDYGDNYFQRKESERQAILKGNTKEAKRERVETIKRVMQQHGMS